MITGRAPDVNDGRPVLTVSGISKAFGPLVVLDDISLRVHRGETICLLGPSGSGKSTLLRCINWLERPDSGEVRLSGERIGVTAGGVVMSDRDLSRIRTRIGMVFQHFELFPHLSVTENLTLAQVKVLGRNVDEAKTRGLKMLDRVGLIAHKEKFPGQLSGGQQQRVAIARALVHEPRLLVCDEPTAALDAQSGQRVMGLVRQVAVQPGRAVIVVTHDSRVFGFGDRIIHMSDGVVERIDDTVSR